MALGRVQPRKRFGQNFLTDGHIIDKIITHIAPQAHDRMVEIGPGMGALTAGLLARLNQLTVVEIDRDLAASLSSRVQHAERLTVVIRDALRFDFSQLADLEHPRLRVVGNLPYNISTPLLFHLLGLHQIHQCIGDMHFMLQKEVVDRLCATPGSKQFGRLSVMTQYYCQVQQLFDVPASAFSPAPQVTSAICRLIPHTVLPIVAQNPVHLSQLVTQLFTMRRKTLRAILKGKMTADQLEQLAIDPMARPEVLQLRQFVQVSDFYMYKHKVLRQHEWIRLCDW